MIETCEDDEWLSKLAVYWAQFEQVSEGLLCYPVHGGRVSMVNEACARMHGYSKEEMQGMKLQDLDVADLTLESPARLHRLQTGEHFNFEVEHYHKDGHIFPLEVSSVIISLIPTNGPDISGCGVDVLVKCFSAEKAPEIITHLRKGGNFILERQRDLTERKILAEEVCNNQLLALVTSNPAVWETMAPGNLDLLASVCSRGKFEEDSFADLSRKIETTAGDKVVVKGRLPIGIRILVMDDEPAVLEVATEFLQYVGYRVDGVANGDEAIKAYQRAVASGDPYQAVLLDLYIDAGVGGNETMERLRAIDPQVKAILSSGNAGDPLIINYASHGFAASLLKPYRLEKLGETLARML